MNTNYEEMTVPELKEIAEKRGIELFSDARKAEIVAALESSDGLLQPAPKEPEAKEGDTPETRSGNQYNYNMSSTVEATVSDDDFWKLKLHS